MELKNKPGNKGIYSLFIKYFISIVLAIIIAFIISTLVLIQTVTYNSHRSIIFILIFLFIMLLIIIVTFWFGHILSQKLQNIKIITDKINKQDLEFTVKYSGIKEIDNILQGLEIMRDELQNTLEQKWQVEQMKQEQISALVHDIKAPLTIITGNTDLMEETSLNKEQKIYMNYINKGSQKIESYIKLLIQATNPKIKSNIKMEEIVTDDFIAEISNQIDDLSFLKHLDVTINKSNILEYFTADKEAISRAILNIVSNAVDYSPNNGTLIFSIIGTSSTISFEIIDSGKGFSNEEIKSATDQFYMGDRSRSSKTHYGMGLYIVNSIAKSHGGKLSLSNNLKTGGAQVTIEIPLSQ